MKATINRTGVLTVTAETELEAYALNQWCDGNLSASDNLLIDLNIPPQLPTAGPQAPKPIQAPQARSPGGW